MGVSFETLYDCKIGAGFRLAVEFVHQGPTICRRDDHLARARFAMAPGILAFMIDVERMMGVLHRRHRKTARDKAWNKLLDQRCLAAVLPADDADDFHRRHWSSVAVAP